MLSRRQILHAGLAAMPLALGALPRHGVAQADAWPSRPIRLVVAWAPGGTVDTIARCLAPMLAASLGRPVVVKNKSGVTGTIAVPDGHTLLATDNTLAMLPYLFQRRPSTMRTASAR